MSKQAIDSGKKFYEIGLCLISFDSIPVPASQCNNHLNLKTGTKRIKLSGNSWTLLGQGYKLFFAVNRHGSVS